MNLSVEHVFYGVAIVFVLWMLLKRRGDVSAGEARRMVKEGARLIDVRSPGEFAAGHIDGAQNIPVQELEGSLKQVGAKDRPVVLYCASGARSAMAARLLKSRGWTTVRNLGAMSRW